jgi:UDP-N-acetyl-D-galactosamine dehydrogenase
MNYNHTITIVGLGYVGLPLAVEFAKKYPVIGFDTNQERVQELNNCVDRTLETDPGELKAVLKRKVKNTYFEYDNQRVNYDEHPTLVCYPPVIEEAGISFTADPEDIQYSNTYIITVPTPIDRFNRPDLTPLLKASETVGKALRKGDIVIYESTVYPGCTEEDCVPVLEAFSGLIFNTDFFCGYSPERINPGDKVNTLTKIKKVTSGSTPEYAKIINELYASIILAGTHLAPCMKVAEASKAIENAQRDINISFVNELALIFDRMNIDTNDVLDAAATKWNFLKYKPGLVGGHCIGVDPYYLAHKAESLGYHPQVILSGRRVNNQMGQFVANKVIKLMIEKEHRIKGASILILGITFKENCPDIRNSRVIDIYNELLHYGVKVDVFDPWADKGKVKSEYGIELLDHIDGKYDGLILAVSHDELTRLDLSEITNCNTVIFDSKSVIARELVDARL